jgi:Ser/Thr protein kinase RdoA (MazF antagonist)
MQSLEESIASFATSSDSKMRPQPIIYSTLSMDGVKDLILQNYDVSEPLDCTFISRSVSDTYRITTPEQRFAVKIYRTRWRSPEDIQWEMRILQHMNARGVDVVLPIPGRDGQIITKVYAPEGLRSAVLFEWVNGLVPKYTAAEHAARYGAALAKLHNAGEEMATSALRPPIDMTYLLEEPMARIRTRMADLPLIAPKLAALEERIRKRCENAERSLGNWGFCHGDIWANNARLEKARLVLFDFDFSGSGWQIFDLASYRWDARRRGAEHPAWRPFIDHYLQVRPSLAESLKYIGLFMILKHLWTTAFFIERAPETGTNFLSDEDLEAVVPYCERIEAEMT